LKIEKPERTIKKTKSKQAAENRGEETIIKHNYLEEETFVFGMHETGRECVRKKNKRKRDTRQRERDKKYAKNT
jgi:hypothetical protein